MLAFVLWLSCSSVEEKPAKESLITASNAVHFASVEKLGAHHSLISLDTTESQFTRELSSTTEVYELWWEDWSRFRFQHRVDGRLTQELMVIDDQPWIYNGRNWRAGDDPESFRNQLKLNWDVWGRVYRSFKTGAQWTEEDVEQLGQRTVQRYSVVYVPPREQPAYGMIPMEMSALVWVDQSTAVRLLGELTAVRENEGFEQRQVLRLERDQIGGRFDLKTPDSIQSVSPLPTLDKAAADRPGN